MFRITRSSNNNLVRCIPSFNIKISIDKYLKSINIANINTNKSSPVGSIVNIDTNEKIYVKGSIITDSNKQVTNIEFCVLDNREFIYIYKDSLNYQGNDTELKDNGYYKVFGYNNNEKIYLGVTQAIKTN